MTFVCKFDGSPDSIVMRQWFESKLHTYTGKINIFMILTTVISGTTQEEKENSK